MQQYAGRFHRPRQSKRWRDTPMFAEDEVAAILPQKGSGLGLFETRQVRDTATAAFSSLGGSSYSVKRSPIQHWVVNTPPPASVYDLVGILWRMDRSGDRTDLLAGLAPGPARDQSASEISKDAMWVTAARDGDRGAFGQLYERYARMVHGILLAKVPVADVDDLVHDVFIRALRRLSTLRETASFGAWLAAIARNVANDYHRRAVPEEPLTDDAADNEIKGGVSRTDHEGPATEVLDAVMSLPDAYRETLILRLVEGMTGPEIAARTGMTHGSVRVNLHRGVEQLRAKLSPDPSRNRPEQERP